MRLEPPYAQADRRNVGTPLHAVRLRPADLDGVRGAVKWIIDQVEGVRVPDVHEARPLRVLVVQVLRPPQELEELPRGGGPARYVASKLLKHRQRSLAPPVPDRVR